MKKITLFRSYLKAGIIIILLLSFSMTACAFNGAESGSSMAVENDLSAETSELDYIKVSFTYRKSDIDYDKIVSAYNSSANRDRTSVPPKPAPCG